MKRFVVAATLCAFCSVAQAGEKQRQKDREEVFAKVTEVDFDEVDVKAGLVGPEGRIVLDRPPLTFPSLYHPRVDFKPEMAASIDEIK